MTIRNMIIVGKNWYGLLMSQDAAAYRGLVTSTFENVDYNGPQITFTPFGKVRCIDCNINLAASASSILNECGEVEWVELGGKVTISQTSPTYPVFWFRGNSGTSSMTLLPGADVTITAGRDVWRGRR